MTKRLFVGGVLFAALASFPALADAGLIEDLLDICKYLMGQSCGGIEP